MKQSKQVAKVKQVRRSFPPTFLTTGQAASHCRVSIPGIKRWIREGWLLAFKTPGGHWRIEVGEFQRFLRKHGMPTFPVASRDVRILVVDDDAGVVDVLVDFLAADARGLKIETATDGYEALIKVGAFQPSVLILDVAMPRLDGLEVCRRLKTNPETRLIKILGITGYPESVPALLAAGADACLTKPLVLEQLQRELDRSWSSLEGRLGSSTNGWGPASRPRLAAAGQQHQERRR